MNIDGFIQKLDDMQRNFNAVFTDAVQLRLSKDFIGPIRLRVEQRSERADGSLFSKYSQKTLATNRDKDKVNKNFSDTGQMWRSFGIKERNTSLFGTEFKIRMSEGVRNTGETNQQIMEKHSKIEGISIIEPSKGEIKVAEVMASKEAIKIIKKYLA